MALSDRSRTDLPKADLHRHAESTARLDRVLARREGREPYDWDRWLARLSELPPGIPRLLEMGGELDTDAFEQLDHDPEFFVARVEDTLEGAAVDGAMLCELRFGAGTILRPDPPFMHLFRDAEARVSARHPDFHAEALISGIWTTRPRAAEVLDACVAARADGLAGVDLLPEPYDDADDWTGAYRSAERLADAGLGITVHAGEFSTASIEAALGVPGVSRIGHGIRAVDSPGLIDQIVERGIVLECCLSSNVVLGAALSFEEHPIRSLTGAGVRVTLNTDNPVRFATSLEREYDLASQLGYGDAELREFTRTAIEASFTSEERREALLASL